jgi:hypothetical protein
MKQLSSASYRSSSFVLALVVGIVAACGDSSGSEERSLSGDYEIVTVDDESLPVFARSGGFSSHWLLSGTLDFRTRGRVTDRRWFETRLSNGSASAPFAGTETVRYALDGDRVIVFRDYGSQVYSDTGTVEGESAIELKVRDIYNAGPALPSSGSNFVVRYVRVVAP